MAVRHVVIPIFIPHKGCPFDCSFCNQKSISGQTGEMTVPRMEQIVEQHLTSMRPDTHVEIGFYGGSFTGIPAEQQEMFLDAAHKYIVRGAVREIRLSTRPDYIDVKTLERLAAYKVRTIELGVQSLDEEVLRQSFRGHGREDVFDAVHLIRQYPFRLGIQTMIGLPADSREKDLDTAREILCLNPDLLRIYPVLVIRGTYLQKLYEEGRYTPLCLEEAVAVCAELLALYEEKGIPVIRMGLQPTDSINENMDVVAGPFHPAFRQLVEARLVLTQLEKQIQERRLCSERKLLIKTRPGNVSNVTGQKASNIEYLKQRYGFREIRVIEEEGLTDRVAIQFLPQ